MSEHEQYSVARSAQFQSDYADYADYAVAPIGEVIAASAAP
jgi:hypothetical protein